MNRKKKVKSTLKAQLKRSKAKLQKSTKPKYIAKADREKLELEPQESVDRSKSE